MEIFLRDMCLESKGRQQSVTCDRTNLWCLSGCRRPRNGTVFRYRPSKV